MNLPVYELNLKKPALGSKMACLREQGVYILERGPVLWRALSCTHAGSGVVSIFDGVPDKRGFFLREETAEAKLIENFNGRCLHYVNPSILGMWMYDAGCFHGLTLVINGQHSAVPPVVSITWMPWEKPVIREAKK